MSEYTMYQCAQCGAKFSTAKCPMCKPMDEARVREILAECCTLTAWTEDQVRRLAREEIRASEARREAIEKDPACSTCGRTRDSQESVYCSNVFHVGAPHNLAKELGDKLKVSESAYRDACRTCKDLGEALNDANDALTKTQTRLVKAARDEVALAAAEKALNEVAACLHHRGTTPETYYIMDPQGIANILKRTGRLS